MYALILFLGAFSVLGLADTGHAQPKGKIVFSFCLDDPFVIDANGGHWFSEINSTTICF